MKRIGTLATAACMSLAIVPSAFAASSTKVYNSGILVLAFLGFCALVVVIQMIPAIMTLVGMLKAMSKKEATTETN